MIGCWLSGGWLSPAWLTLGQTLGPLVLPQVVRPEHFLGCTCCKVLSGVHRGLECKDSHLGEMQIHHPEVYSDPTLVLLTVITDTFSWEKQTEHSGGEMLPGSRTWQEASLLSMKEVNDSSSSSPLPIGAG